MESTRCYGGFTAILNRDAGASTVDGTFCYGGSIFDDSDPRVSLISSGVPYRESSDGHVLAGDSYYRAIVLSIDDGVALILSSDRNGFIDEYGLRIQSAKHIDGVTVCCMKEAVVDILIRVIKGTIPWSLGVAVINIDRVFRKYRRIFSSILYGRIRYRYR